MLFPFCVVSHGEQLWRPPLRRHLLFCFMSLSSHPHGSAYLALSQLGFLTCLLALELLERAAVPVCPTSCTVSGTRSALSKYLQKKERFQEGCRTIFSVESPHSKVGSGAECCKWLHLKHCTFTSWAHVDCLPCVYRHFL